MIHSCKLQCHSMPIEEVMSLGIDDPGKWMPFSFHMGIVIGCKLTSDDPKTPEYNCTTVYTEHADSYVIDTPFVKFDKLFKAFNEPDARPHLPPSTGDSTSLSGGNEEPDL